LSRARRCVQFGQAKLFCPIAIGYSVKGHVLTLVEVDVCVVLAEDNNKSTEATYNDTDT
jgi:hypothetical protein